MDSGLFISDVENVRNLAEKCDASFLIPNGKYFVCADGCPEHHECKNGVCCPTKGYPTIDLWSSMFQNTFAVSQMIRVYSPKGLKTSQDSLGVKTSKAVGGSRISEQMGTITTFRLFNHVFHIAPTNNSSGLQYGYLLTFFR